MIKLFGPLVGLWTMHFKAKHSFLKQVAVHSNCFRNIPVSLAVKHQFMISYYLSKAFSLDKPTADVSTVSTVHVVVLGAEIAQAIQEKHPNTVEVHLAKAVSSKGLNFRKVLILANGITSGLPDFGEIVQMCLVLRRLWFMVRQLCGRYREHFRSFQFIDEGNVVN